MKFIAVFLTLLAFNAHAQVLEGHSTNNGGGVICINGSCKTLLEAGLQLKPQYQGVWIPQAKMVSRVHTLIGGIRLHSGIVARLPERILGRLDIYRRVEVIDPAKLEEIRQRYINVFSESGFPVDPSSFELVAFSSDNTVSPALTYLLPKFFTLNEEQQARVLIHEGLYRAQPSGSLLPVLQFETAMFSAAISHETDTDLKMAAYRLGILDKAQLFGHLIGQFPSFKTEAAVLGGAAQTGQQIKIIFKIDPNKLLKFGELDPRITYALSRLDILEFKYAASGDSYNDSFFGFTDAGKFTLQYRPYGGYMHAYEFTDSESLDILLPY